jgi:hypothetical protein
MPRRAIFAGLLRLLEHFAKPFAMCRNRRTVNNEGTCLKNHFLAIGKIA